MLFIVPDVLDPFPFAGAAGSPALQTPDAAVALMAYATELVPSKESSLRYVYACATALITCIIFCTMLHPPRDHGFTLPPHFRCLILPFSTVLD